MKRLEGKALKSLSCAQWHRIHKTLLQRFKAFDNGNIVNISFGPKNKRDRISKGNLAVRFHVRKKRCPRRKDCHVPPFVEVRIKLRTGKFAMVVLPTDVELEQKVVATSEYFLEGQMILGSTGIPVSIPRSIPGAPKRWGMLTVGHPFEGTVGTIDVIIDARKGHTFDVPAEAGVRSTLPSSLFDVAFLHCKKSEMTRGGFFESDGVLPLMVTESQLIEIGMNDEVGWIMRPEKGKALMTFTDYFPSKVFESGGFGKMRAVIKGKTRKRGVIFVGTSGSTWRIRNRLAGIQFAAETPDFQVGYAQAAFAIVTEWLSKQFDERPTIHRSF